MSAGMHYIERAISLCSKRRKALDVGCGSGGRIIDALTSAGFEVLGLDVSDSMLALAKSRHPAAKFVHGDVCEWEPSDKYDLIIAWDSVFHVRTAISAQSSKSSVPHSSRAVSCCSPPEG